MLITQDVLIEEIISSFERTSSLSYSRFQSNAWQDEGVMFLLTSLTMEKLRIFFVLFYILFRRKKQVLLELT